MNFMSLKKYMQPSLIDTDQDSDDGNDDENINVDVAADAIVQNMELDPVESIVTVFEQLGLNVNSRALAKLLTDNPEQSDTSIVSDKPTETSAPQMISERDRGEYGNPFDM